MAKIVAVVYGRSIIIVGTSMLRRVGTMVKKNVIIWGYRSLSVVPDTL